MKRRARGTVRVLTRCARCGQTPDLYQVERLTLFLGGHWHELVVCRGCQQLPADKPTDMERDAMRSGDDPIDAAEFADRWRADVVRVQRTARHFLAVVYDGLAAQCRAEWQERKAEAEAASAGWKERARIRMAAGEDDEDDDYEDDDDLPF